MKNKILLSALLMAFAILVSISTAQDAKPDSEISLKKQLESPAVNFKIEISPQKAKPGDTVTLEIEADVVEGWHIYPQQKGDKVPAWLPTEIKFDARGLEPSDKKFECSKEPSEELVGKEIQSHLSGKFSWTQKFKIAKGTKTFGGKGSIKFQVCDHERCLPPQTLKFELGGQSEKVELIAGKFKPIGEPISIELEKCKKTRSKVVLSLMSLLFSTGRQVEKLVLKGTHKFPEGQKLEFFLPSERKYRIENSGENNTRVFNNSTYFSIDRDGDGEISKPESYPANMPFRIANKMFKVVEMDREKKIFKIQQIDHPMFGSVIGQPVAPFEYTTVDGKTVSNKSILGKVTILDIWAVT